MTCPDLNPQRTEHFYDSTDRRQRRLPSEFAGLDHLPRPRTCDRPPTCLPQAHYMLAWDDSTRQYYIYTKCIWHEDAILMANTLLDMQLVTEVQLYELAYRYRPDYISNAVLFLLDGLLPQRTLQATYTDLMHIFRTLLIARGYVPKLYYDDVDEDLPITRHTVWRPRKPKTARGWNEMLNLPCTW